MLTVLPLMLTVPPLMVIVSPLMTTVGASTVAADPLVKAALPSRGR